MNTPRANIMLHFDKLSVNLRLSMTFGWLRKRDAGMKRDASTSVAVIERQSEKWRCIKTAIG
ncbi:hypothetical protein CJD36_021990 [Flavipsychrobacter stenotrophus]|uniref:Uncharacterized protein n=1 Tax=Flavipsychrobacter stenotrophus TaxID=2077091 RepID=A0A2S7SPK4_9BACT|nr:hypothetical protein CJD36_021990 [Flavipsychrobacter stenotrophus]